MKQQSRDLDIINLDDLNPVYLNGVIEFFNREFPDPSGSLMTEDFFLTKIASPGAVLQGYMTVAIDRGVVVGCCSAVVKNFRVNHHEVKIVEIGDTFTSSDYRRNCFFKSPYPGTTSNDDYLNKSIFGRLATETLDRARAGGAVYVYGTPNTQAKLSWVGRMGFKLVDGGFTVRISSPHASHKKFSSSAFLRSIASIYLRITLTFSGLRTFCYKLNLMPKNSYIPVDGPLVEINFENCLTIINSDQWVKNRFLLNSDKDYKVVKILNRFTKKILGYMFFLEKTGVDDFSLLMLSKTISSSEKILRMTLPLSRRAAHEYFTYNNLSLWIDNRTTSPKSRYVYGFLSGVTQVEIVGKDLQDLNLERMNFSNFNYGDSDLG